MSSPEGWGQLWRWPLYSPRRFFSCVAVLLGLIAVTNMALSARHSSSPAQAAPATSTSPSPTASGTESGQAPATVTSQPSTPPTSGAPLTPTATPKPGTPAGVHQASSTAVLFTRAWADHTKAQAVWLAQVRRYADPEYADGLSKTDPRNVPATKVTGAPHPVAVYAFSASIEVPTDAGTMVVALISDGHAWRVTSILPKH